MFDCDFKQTIKCWKVKSGYFFQRHGKELWSFSFVGTRNIGELVMSERVT